MGIFIDAVGDLIIDATELDPCEEAKADAALAKISEEYNTVIKPWSVGDEGITFNRESGAAFKEAFEHLKDVVSKVREIGFMVYGDVIMIYQDDIEVQLFKVDWDKPPERHVAVFKLQ